MLAAAAAVSSCRVEPARPGGLVDIRSSGELRVVVRPGFLHAPPAGGQRTDQVAALRQLAGRLGVRVRWVECRRNDQVLQWLLEGRGDIGVGRFSSAALLGTGAVPTAAVDWVEDLLVATPDTPYTSFPDAAGANVRMLSSSLTPRLASALAQDGLRVVPVAEEVTLEELLRRVRLGRYGLGVVDSGVLDASPARGAVRVLGPLAERRPLVWAVREDAGRLRRAVDDFLFAEQVLARGRQVGVCRDLEEVRHSGVLRLVTRNSAVTCTVERGGLTGFEYELALELARQLRVRLELAVPPLGVDPVSWLEGGHGDLAALHEPMAPEDEGRFLSTRPYRLVDLVSVVPAQRPPVAAAVDLAGMEVVASRPVAALCRMVPLEPPLRAFTPHPGADGAAVLLHVARGEGAVAVVDEDTAALELEGRPGLSAGAVVLPEVPLVWILNPSSPRLRDRADAFLTRAERSGLVRQLVASQLGTWRPPVPRHLPRVPAGALTPFDARLKEVGEEYGIDWRLLASLMYEESRFDPDAVGPGGSSGLFQFMPSTWNDLGVEDPHRPTEAIEAGGWYLRWLMDRFSDLELRDQVAMAIASYNVGPRHVFDARRLAAQMRLDPDRWSGNVETALVILDDPEVARRFAAGVCRCRRAVAYTRRILRRYRAYTEQYPPV